MQSVSGGKVSILGGRSVGQTKQKKLLYVHVLTQNSFRDRAISLYSSKVLLRTVSDTGIYCSGDKVGTVYLV
jgi:hypothetical protein